MNPLLQAAKAREPITHELKCHPGPYQAVVDGSKPFEWRKDDRDYRVGDTLWLRQWDPTPIGMVISETDDAMGFSMSEPIYRGYTGEEIKRIVTYIIREGFGIPEGYCIMGLAQASARWSDEEIERVAGIFYDTMNGLPEGITQEEVAWAKSGFKAALRYARDHALLSGEGTPAASLEAPPDYVPGESLEPIIESLKEVTRTAWEWRNIDPRAYPELMDKFKYDLNRMMQIVHVIITRLVLYSERAATPPPSQVDQGVTMSREPIAWMRYDGDIITVKELDVLDAETRSYMLKRWVTPLYRDPAPSTREKELEDALREFRTKLEASQVKMDPDVAQVLNDSFWNSID